jgi:hypothetical protein
MFSSPQLTRVRRRVVGYFGLVPNSSDLVAVMAELHAALVPGDLAQTLRRVTDAAVELLPDVDAATITVEHADGRFETAAATGSGDVGVEPAGEGDAPTPRLAATTAARLDHLQKALGEGPAVEVADSPNSSGVASAGTEDLRWGSGRGSTHRGGHRSRDPIEPSDADLVPRAGAGDLVEPGQASAVTTSDLSRDDRYPAYGTVAAELGVRAQAAIVLFDIAQARGILNLFSHRLRAFDETALLTDVFAHHSATALGYAVELHERESTVAERVAVGQALGIVMGRYTLSESDAFGLLQRTAEHRAVSVRLVAQELVARAEGAGSPQWPGQ